MATYLKGNNNRIAWRYTTADGENFRVSAKAVYVGDVTDGAKYGGQAAPGDMRPLPASFKMRSVDAVSAAGVTRRIICYDTTCDCWATPGTTVTRSYMGVDTVFTTTSQQHSESYGSQTKQQA